MHQVIFSHPAIDRNLVVSTGANQITWSYNLITQAYPTYAGEVVQVLGCNIDNLQVQGDVRSYAEMESIYTFFLEYMQKATQGAGGVKYSPVPMKMEYPHRGWTMYIKPISLPAMTYGRDVVIPTWQMTAHIEDPDPQQRELTLDNALQGEIDNFKTRVAADIGFRRSNPYSDPLAVVTKEENDLYLDKGKLEIVGLKVEGAKGGGVDPDWQKALSGVAKQMQDMFNSLLNGTFKDLFDTYGISDASKPTTSDNGAKKSAGTTQTKNAGG